MDGKVTIEIDGKSYDVPERVANELDRLTSIEIAARRAQLIMSQVAVLIRAVTR